MESPASGLGREQDASSSGQNRRWTLSTQRRKRGNEQDGGRGGEGNGTREFEQDGSASTATADGNEVELDGNEVELDGNEVELDGNEVELDGNEVELDGRAQGNDQSPTRQRLIVRHEVDTLSPPRQRQGAGPSSRGGAQNTTDDVVLIETTRGWARNMPNGMESDDDGGAIDLTGSQEDDVQIVSSNVTRSVPAARKRRKHEAPRPVATTTEALVLRMLQQQQAAIAAAPPPEPSKNPTCGICFEPMGKNTDRQMAAGNCGHVYCKPCLSHSVKTRKKCPMCSSKMTLKQIRNIFFEM